MPKTKTAKPRVSGPTQSKAARREAGRVRVEVWLSEETAAYLDRLVASEGDDDFHGLPEGAIKRGRAGAVESLVQLAKKVDAASRKHRGLAEMIFC
jgi:hypothetical protein